MLDAKGLPIGFVSFEEQSWVPQILFQARESCGALKTPAQDLAS